MALRGSSMQCLAASKRFINENIAEFSIYTLIIFFFFSESFILCLMKYVQEN